ncbi:hypothetical protein PVK06_005638 [Gossypium arboreum]|uniref:RNase H type-1 domain-containing protein n=1 Tax=Gossypium arboreum TaxID=29729 RepID=A0ABR0QV44_GOSAR|nr:hypothetical protein PVK06_005638 [Gossypium arboreum]
MRLLDKKTLEDFITLLWNNWNNRNNFIFWGKEDVACVIWERALTLSNDFWVHNFNHKPIIPFTLTCKNWKKLKSGFVKVNINATVSNEIMGYWVIVIDTKGFMVGNCRGCKDMVLASKWVELVALEEGMQLAKSLNFQKVIFESSNASLINRIKRNGRDITIMGQYVHETGINLKKFALVDVTWALRSCNEILDFICNFVLHNNCFWLFNMNYPKEIH